MDSVTQITLGAAVGEAVLGRQLGNRAILWGAVFGTLPDMDAVFSPLLDPVEFIVHHRGLSHSLLAVAVASPLLSLRFSRWYRSHTQPTGYWRWFVFFFLIFLTHILLDCCTNYGTQIFAPFSDVRVAWNNIFIIDPLYTIPLLICVAACLFLHRTSSWRRRLNYLGLVLSTGYLALTFTNKSRANQVFANALADQQIAATRMMTCPTPLNTILWTCIAEVENGYYVGFYSLLDFDANVEYQFVERQADLLGDWSTAYEVNRLIWFANGYYCVRPHEEGLLLHVMNFGKLDFAANRERYPFSYLLNRKGDSGLIVKSYRTPIQESPSELLRMIWIRLKGI